LLVRGFAAAEQPVFFEVLFLREGRGEGCRALSHREAGRPQSIDALLFSVQIQVRVVGFSLGVVVERSLVAGAVSGVVSVVEGV